jgi:cytochrome P450
MSSLPRAIPGESGTPILGHTLRFMKDCNRLFSEMHAEYGDVYYNKFLSSKVVHLLSPDGNEFVLLDREKNFSSRLAWNMNLKKLFPNGLMLRDGEDHRFHRRLMGAPFKSSALELYVQAMNPDIEQEIATWADHKDFLFYPAIKKLTLDLATKIFIGEKLAEESDAINQAFVDLVAAAMVIVRYPMFGNKYQRGLEGRQVLENYFSERVARKQASNDTDMFAEISRAQAEDGSGFSHQDIIDHMIFLMMAAHDTTTSSLSTVCYALAKNPEWQDRILQQVNQHGSNALLYSEMGDFDAAGLVLKEALRLYPPLPIIPRCAIKDCEFKGYQINKGDMVNISPSFTHRDPSIWTNPESFDPMRFSPERAEDRQHKHAWVPFGGGAHKCLGIKFAELQVKTVLFHLLKQYELKLDTDYTMPFQAAPIGKPTDSLPVQLIRR